MRTSGALTGLTALVALALSDLSAPAVYCWLLLALAFVALIVLAVTTIRPDWTARFRSDLRRLLGDALHRAHRS